MCIMPGSEPEAVLSILGESREAHRQAAVVGAKIFGAFLEGKSIYRWGRSFLRAYSSWGTRTGYQIASCG